MRILFLLSFIVLLLGNPIDSSAQKMTKVVVRAQAVDAKFIGTSMGGSKITITNAVTGEILAQGLTEGSTGDTEKLVTSPRKRYEKISTDGSAKLVANLLLKNPVFVTISATGPQDYDEKRTWTSTQLWLIPGKDITGDGIILDVPGFVVDLIKPDSAIKNKIIPIKAKVVMMCGCTTKPDGTWNSSEYDITALIYKDGNNVASVPLGYSGKPNYYEAQFKAPIDGTYKVVVYVFHPETGNSGVDEMKITVD